VKINASGMIAGYYYDTSENSHGFIRKPNGNFTEFDVSGLYSVTVTSMNNIGQVVGWGGHVTGSGTWAHGFLRFADGKVVEINVPGAVATSPTGINEGGEVAGSYMDSKGNHGFVRDAQGNYTVFDDPDVVISKIEKGTFVNGLQSNGTVAGYYTGKTGTAHGFIRDQFGNFTNFDAPDAGGGDGFGTLAKAINELGEITGYYVDSHANNYGFVRDAQGTLTEFSPPGAYDTIAFGINSSGKTVGLWGGQQSGGGFVRDSSGAITTFSVPLRNTATYPFDINDAGQITGSWVDAGQRAWHGFVQVN
jgi:hypothetical protein